MNSKMIADIIKKLIEREFRNDSQRNEGFSKTKVLHIITKL
jgi:hypothetical protein